MVKQFEIYLVALDPTVGSEIQKMRPALIISPNEMNDNLATVIIAPMTSTTKKYPTRVNCVFNDIVGQIAIDQLRAVDKQRLKKKIGAFTDTALQKRILTVLHTMFS